MLEQLGQTDSSIVYYKKVLKVTTEIKEYLTICKALANSYFTKEPLRSVTYFARAQKIIDSLFTSDKVKAIEALTCNEQEDKRADKRRKRAGRDT